MVVLMGGGVRAGGRYGITMAWELKEGGGVRAWERGS